MKTRFKDFLSESNYANFRFTEGLLKIKEECGHFIHQAEREYFLYRGMRRVEAKEIFFSPHPKSRAPSDSGAAFNVIFNAGVKLTFDINLIRPTSIFCAGDASATKEYGQAYFIFPKGDFKFLYSNLINDSYVDEDTIHTKLAKVLELTSDDVMKVNKPLNYISKVKRPFEKVYRDVGGNISSAVENVVSDDTVLEEAFEEITDANGSKLTASEIRMALKAVFKSLYTNTGSLQDAIKTGGNEILIYESEGYYSISREFIREYVNNRRDLEGQTPEEFLTNYFHHGGGV